MHPQSDGMVERFNRTLVEGLAKLTSTNQRDWDAHIPLFLMAYRSSVHEATKLSPAQVVFGRNLRLPFDLEFGRIEQEEIQLDDHIGDLRSRLLTIHDSVRKNLRINGDRMKARYDLKANSTGFQEGDLVWLYNPKRQKGLSPKLQLDWEGPYTIDNKINDVVYRISRNPRTRKKVVYIDRLTPYNGMVLRAQPTN